jgi:hypothetical protein
MRVEEEHSEDSACDGDDDGKKRRGLSSRKVTIF